MKRPLLWFLGVICILLLGSTVYLLLRPVYQPTLAIVGDIGNCREVSALRDLGKVERVSLNGKTFHAVSLLSIITGAVPNGAITQVLLISSDGFSAAVDGSSLGECYIACTAQDGWRGVNPAHPVSSNATHLAKIVVIAAAETASSSLTIVAPEQTSVTTAGALYAGDTTEYPYHEGTAEKETDGVNYTSAVYTRRTCVTSRQMGIAQGGQLLLFTAAGESSLVAGDALFQLSGNRIDYLSPEDRLCLQDIRMICVDPPKAALSDLYYHAAHYQAAGDKVMLVFAHGLTETAYQEGEKQHRFPYLTAHFKHTAAFGAYPMTEQAWRQTVWYGMADCLKSKPLTAVETADLDFDEDAFDGQIAALCDFFDGVVIVAPLPASEMNLTYDSFCTLYLVEDL